MKTDACSYVQSDLEETKKRQQKEQLLEHSLHQIVVYTLYLVIITLISYGQRDTTAYFVTKHIEDTFVNVKGYHPYYGGPPPFKEVMNE